jgi:hopanoid biosynthesis associated protein HpnK
MKKLIVNADDFGFTRGVNIAIVRAYKEGVLTSTSLMANGEAFDDAVELARANPGLAVGIHLTAVGGKPVASAQMVPSLVDSSGLMPETLTRLFLKLSAGKIRASDIEREFCAQVEKVIAVGITPTHLDAHKHSQIHPRVMEAMARVAARYGIKRVRNPFETANVHVGPAARARRHIYLKQLIKSRATAICAARFRKLASEHGLKFPDYFYGAALTGLLDSEAVIAIVRSLKDGTSELMCHPGFYDEELERAPTRLKRERELEFEALSDDRVRRAIAKMSINLISYRELD